MPDSDLPKRESPEARAAKNCCCLLEVALIVLGVMLAWKGNLVGCAIVAGAGFIGNSILWIGLRRRQCR